MAPPRHCQARIDAAPCRAAPLTDAPYCFWHSLEHAAEAAEARRLGGLRRRREHTLAGAYDLDGLSSIAAIRRLVEVAALDTLGLENSIARARTLACLAAVALRLLEAGQAEQRLGALEAAVYGQPQPGPPVLTETVAGEVGFVWEEES